MLPLRFIRKKYFKPLIMSILKKITLFFTFLFLFHNIAFSQVQPKKVGLQRIEFTSTTRGSQELITVNRNKIVCQKTGVENSTKTIKITPKQWQQFRYVVQQIDLKNISTLPAPSNASHHDGAKASNFVITTHKKTFQSSTFDNYDSPNVLKPLMNKILKFYK
jgi:hypothetical protein